jgi:hypothetical protein
LAEGSAPIEIGLSGRCAPGVGLRRRKGDFSVGAGRPWAEGSAPIEIGLFGRYALGVGLRRRKGDFSVGAGRPWAEGLWRPNSFGVQADRGPKAFTPIEIGLPRRCAPGVGLRRRKGDFSVGAGRPLAEGSAPIEIGLFGRYALGVGLRRRKGDFSVGAGRPLAEGSAPIEIGLFGRYALGVGLRRRKGDFSVGAGRPSAEGLWRPNSFGVQADRGPQASRGRTHSTRTPSWPKAS